MGNPIVDIVDIITIRNSIAEREKIIDGFNRSGSLDRDDAIRKILELRNTDQEVLAVTAGTIAAGGSIPFSVCPNAQLVNELQMQVDILRSKLIKKTEESLPKEK